MHSPTVPLAYGPLLVWVGLSAVVIGLVALRLRRRGGAVATYAVAVFAWSLVVIALVTLVPDDGCRGAGCPPPTYETHPCSWVVSGGVGLLNGPIGARDLNALLFAPSGVLVGYGAVRGLQARRLVPLGLGLLVAYSALIELVQRHVGRLGRACDLTDVVDNASGAGAGVALGLASALVVTRVRRRRAPRDLEATRARAPRRQ